MQASLPPPASPPLRMCVCAHAPARRYVLYAPYVAAMQRRAAMSQGPHSTPAEEFAERAVAVLLRRHGPPRHFVYGHFSTLFRAVSWLPLWLRDHLLAMRFGLLLPLPPAAATGITAGGSKAD
jgi:hypothetical protein